MRSHFCRDLFLDPHAVRVHDVDDTRRIIDDAQVRDSNIEAAKLVIVPDRVGWPRNRYSRLFSPDSRRVSVPEIARRGSSLLQIFSFRDFLRRYAQTDFATEVQADHTSSLRAY